MTKKEQKKKELGVKSMRFILNAYYKIFGYPKTRVKDDSLETVPVWKDATGEHIIEYKFTINNTDYFSFKNELSLGNLRGSVAYGFVEEFQLRFTKEHFDAAYKAIIESLNASDIVNAITILNNLKERRDWIFEPITVLKLASVLFFDKNENPYTYDWDYNQKKIADWLKVDNIMTGFFLRLPLMDSLIHLNFSNSALEDCLKSIRTLERKQQELLINTFPSEDTRTEVRNILGFEQETLEQLIHPN